MAARAYPSSAMPLHDARGARAPRCSEGAAGERIRAVAGSDLNMLVNRLLGEGVWALRCASDQDFCGGTRYARLATLHLRPYLFGRVMLFGRGHRRGGTYGSQNVL